MEAARYPYPVRSRLEIESPALIVMEMGAQFDVIPFIILGGL